MATCGTRPGSASMIFFFASGRLMTAATVVSEPVPAVVGIATMGGSLRPVTPYQVTWSMPSMSSRSLSGLAMSAPIALAQSMGEPPPREMRLSQPDSLKSFVPSRTSCLDGFGCTWSKTVYRIPAASSPSVQSFAHPRRTRSASVTSKGLLTPSCRSTSASWLRLPSPLRTLGSGMGSTRVAAHPTFRLNVQPAFAGCGMTWGPNARAPPLDLQNA
mmetsp:Transcript_72304/g.172674  ORF Transcript_72304/g.172674 Transcript_72304/m.172674 type:complete len:216 (+) Transcript_72304:1029-1676(+)